MADLVITAASVKPGAAANFLRGIVSGTNITAGMVVARNADGTISPADANGTPPLTVPVGIACCTAAIGQAISYVDNDTDFTAGATTVSGTAYFLSVTPGGICPAADLVTGSFASLVAFGQGTTKFVVKIAASGQALP